MQYLMVLLVMGGVLLLGIGIVLGISYALGVAMHSREASPPDPGNSDKCAQCQADRDWYENLPVWKRNAVTAWWLANRYQCAARGCR